MKVSSNEYIDQITDKIYLGCIDGAGQKDYLLSQGVTHFISVCQADLLNFKNFKRILINIEDSESENIYKHLKTALDYIESADKVYIHCMAGVSRSPSIVIAYLMWKNRLNYNKAYWLVKNKRKFICPNDGFRKQLQIFETKLIENDYDLEKIDFDFVIKNFN